MGCCVMRLDFTRWRVLCAAAAVVAAASSAIGIFSVISLRAEYRAHNTSARESSALRSAAETREASLARSKSFLSQAAALPPRAETANKFYAALLEAVSACGFSEASVSASAARDGESVFIVSGRAEYARLRQFILSLRQFPFLAQLSKLSMSAAAGGEVDFSAEVAAAAADAEGSER